MSPNIENVVLLGRRATVRYDASVPCATDSEQEEVVRLVRRYVKLTRSDSRGYQVVITITAKNKERKRIIRCRYQTQTF
jgi:hypothetical protein